MCIRDRNYGIGALQLSREGHIQFVQFCNAAVRESYLRSSGNVLALCIYPPWCSYAWIGILAGVTVCMLLYAYQNPIKDVWRYLRGINTSLSTTSSFQAVLVCPLNRVSIVQVGQCQRPVALHKRFPYRTVQLFRSTDNVFRIQDVFMKMAYIFSDKIIVQ